MILARLRYLQAVGGWHGDAVRNVTGHFQGWTGGTSGPFYSYYLGGSRYTIGGGSANNAYGFDASIVVPTAADNHTRAYAVLGCIYVR